MCSDHKALEHAALEGLDAMASLPRLQGPLGRLFDWLDKALVGMATLTLLVLAATVLLQVVARLSLPFPVSWTEEFSRYLFIYMVALSAGSVLRRHRNVSVELFHHLLKPRAKAFIQACLYLLIGLFACLVMPYAWQYAQNGVWQTSPTLGVPMMYVFFSTVVTFGLLLLYSALGLIESLIAFCIPVDACAEREA